MMEHALLMVMAISLLTPVNVTAYTIYMESAGFQAICSVDIVHLQETALITGIYCRASPPGAITIARYIISDVVPGIVDDMVNNPAGEKTVAVGFGSETLTVRIAWRAGGSEEVYIITPAGAGILGGVAGATIAGAILTLKERKKYDLTAPPYELV